MIKKKIVIIGCGFIGFIYAKVLKKLNCEVVAIADTNSKRLKKTLQICSKNTQIYNNYLELYKKVETSKYDIVAIAVPANHHLKIIKKFSKIKKHIFCEKPFTNNYAEARIAVKLCEKNKVALAVGFKMRYESVFQKLKAIIDSKMLGNIEYVSISYFQKKPYQKWAIKNGIHRESFVHPLDLLMWLFGKNIKIKSLEKNFSKKNGQKIDAFLKLQNINFFISNRWLNKYANFAGIGGSTDWVLNAIGTKGQLVLIRPDFIKVFLDKKTIKYKLPTFNYDLPFNKQWKSFINYINTNNVGDLVVNKSTLHFHKIIDKI